MLRNYWLFLLFKIRNAVASMTTTTTTILTPRWGNNNKDLALSASTQSLLTSPHFYSGLNSYLLSLFFFLFDVCVLPVAAPLFTRFRDKQTKDYWRNKNSLGGTVFVCECMKSSALDEKRTDDLLRNCTHRMIWWVFFFSFPFPFVSFLRLHLISDFVLFCFGGEIGGWPHTNTTICVRLNSRNR